MVPGYSIIGSYVSGNGEVSSSGVAYPEPCGAIMYKRVVVSECRRKDDDEMPKARVGRIKCVV